MKNEIEEWLLEASRRVYKRCREILDHQGILMENDYLKIVYEELGLEVPPRQLFDTVGYSYEIKPVKFDDDGRIIIDI